MSSSTNCISVIVPVYARNANSLGDLRSCLESVRSNDLPAPNTDIEVVVVDDGSPDDACRAIETVAAGYDAKFVHLRENVGAGLARNAGVAAATSDLLVFIDSDCVAAKKWICELIRPIVEGQCEASTACYGGPVVRSWLTVFQDDDFAYRHPSLECEVSFLNSCNMAITRRAFNSCGGFPPQRVGEDGVLGSKLAEQGMPPHFVPHAAVKHNYRNSVKRYYRQRFSFARFLVLGITKAIGRRFIGRTSGKTRGVSSFSIPRTGLALVANVSGVGCLGAAVVISAFTYRTAGVIAAAGLGSLALEVLTHGKFILFVAKRHGARQTLMTLIGLYVTDSAYFLGSMAGLLRPAVLESKPGETGAS